MSLTSTFARKSLFACVVPGLLAALLAPTVCGGAESLFDPALRWGYLSNGTGYLVIENHAAPAVSAVAIIPGGSGSESWANQGASHFLEHLLFNGTAVRTQEQIYDQMDLLGTYNNASTRNTHVVFMILSPTEHFWDAFAVQTDMLFNSTLPAEKLEKERGIILEELARDASSPEYATARVLDLDLFGAEGYGLPTLGSPTSIATLTRDEILSFYQRNYTPNRMIFALLGDLDAQVAIDSLEARVGAWAGGSAAPLAVPGPPLENGPRVSYHVSERQTPLAQLAWIGPDPRSADFLAFRARFQLLCDGAESPLASALDAACGDAITSYEASISEFPGFSLQTIRLEVIDPSITESITARVRSAAATLQDYEIAERRFESWKRRTESDEIFLREKPHYYGIMRGEVMAARGLAAVANELPALRSLALTDLTAAPLPLAGPPHRVSLLLPAGSTSAPQPSGTAGASWQRYVLSNGVQVLARSGAESEVLAAHLFVRGRSAREPEGRAGLAELLHSLLGKATASHSSEALALEMERIGAQLKTADSPFVPYDDFYTVPEFSYLRFQSLDRYAGEAFHLLSEMVSEPQFEEKEFFAAKSSLVSRAQQSAGSSRRSLERQIARAISPAAREEVFGTVESLEPTTLFEVEAFAGEYLDPRGFLLVVASGLPSDSLRGLLEESFGGIPPSAAPAGAWSGRLFDDEGVLEPPSTPHQSFAEIAQRLQALPHGPWAALKTGQASTTPDLPTVPLLLEETGSEQSQIALLRLIRSTPDRGALLTVANRVLSDRIAFQVREREGLAYSIGSSLRQVGPDAWLWFAQAGTRPENLPTVADRFLTSPDLVLDDPPDELEIRKSAASLRGRGLMRRITRLNAAYAAGVAILNGQDPDGIEAREQELEGVSQAELRNFVAELRTAPGAVVIAR